MASETPPAPVPPPPSSYGVTTQTRSGPQRPPVRRRASSRRPIPPLIFIVILAVVALAVWFNVLQTDEARPDSAADDCPAPPTVSALDPATVRLRIFNATTTAGLAAQASAEFQARGFPVAATDNDRSGREVLGVGEVRHGARGAEQAAFVALFLPGITLVRDTRADDLIDVALGPDYVGLAAPDAVAVAIATPVAPTDVACTTADPSETVAEVPTPTA